MNLTDAKFRAIAVFIAVFTILWLLLRLLASVGIEFFGSSILIMIGAGWSAYWVWKKTEHGRY